MGKPEPQTDSNDSVEEKYTLKHFFVVSLISVAILIAIEVAVFCSVDSWVVRSQFGDMFGVGNAVASVVAFAAFVCAILLQREELKLQRKELTETRRELKGQKEQLGAQSEHLAVQNFENRFFQLLRLHHDIVKAIDLVNATSSGNTNRTVGRDCITVFYKRFKSEYSSRNNWSETEVECG